MSQRYGLSVGKILHPTDFSHGSDVAFLHALRIACAARGSLSILHVDREQKHPNWDQYPSVRDTLSRWKLLPPDAARSDVASLGIQIHKSSLADADAAHGILRYLDKHPADLIVLATHQRHGLDRWIHKTVAGTINHRTDGATLFVPYGCSGFVDERTGVSRLTKVLIPVDHDPAAMPAVEVAADLIEVLADSPCDVRLFHAGGADSVPSVHLRNKTRIRWHWSCRSGSVVQNILQEAEEFGPDIIVMTTAGRHGFLDALRGSTTEQIVEHAMCPVLAVHAWGDI